MKCAVPEDAEMNLYLCIVPVLGSIAAWQDVDTPVSIRPNRFVRGSRALSGLSFGVRHRETPSVAGLCVETNPSF